MKKKELEPVSNLLDAVLARVGVGRAPDLARLVNDWPELAGHPWDDGTRPTRLSDGDLVVEVPNGAVASLLRYQIPGLIERLQEALGSGVVTSVSLRVARPGR